MLPASSPHSQAGPSRPKQAVFPPRLPVTLLCVLRVSPQIHAWPLKLRNPIRQSSDHVCFLGPFSNDLEFCCTVLLRAPSLQNKLTCKMKVRNETCGAVMSPRGLPHAAHQVRYPTFLGPGREPRGVVRSGRGRAFSHPMFARQLQNFD